MIIRSRPTTLNTSFRKKSVTSFRFKQIVKLLIIGVITINLLVILFNLFLHIVGTW